MADDKPNTLGGKPATSSKLEELGKRFSSRMMGSSAQEEKLVGRLSELDYQLSQIRPSPNTSAAEMATNIANIQSQRAQIENRLKGIEGIRSSVAGKLYAGGVDTALRRSNVSADVNSLAGSSAILGQAAGNIGSPTFRLEQQQQESMASIISKSAELRELVKNNPTNRRAIEGLQGDISGGIQGAASAQAALNLQRRAGLDVRSRFLASNNTIDRLSNEVGAAELSENVARGRMGTRADHEASLRSMLSEIGTLRKTQAGETDAKKFEELQKSIDELTDSAKGASDVLREMKRQGAGGGRFGSAMQMIGMAAGAGANIVDTWSYENPLRQRQNEIRYAELGNRQFTDVQNALGGDMGALRRLGGAYGRAGGLNDDTKMFSRVSTGLRLGSDLLGNAVQGAGSMNVVGRVGAGLNAVGNISTAAGNWNQQAGERGSSLATADIQRADVRNFIQDTTSQAYVDYAKAIGGASMGMGGTRGALFEQMLKPGTLGALAGQGIGADRAGDLARMAVGSLGRQFTNVGTIEAAGKVERGGYMSAEQYFQSLGRMSTASGNAAGSFQEILKNAVATGMDSSKNISQMVDATTALSEKSARIGVDMFGATSELMGRAVGGMSNVPVNMRATAAAGAVDFANSAASDQGLNLTTIQEQARIGKFFPGATQRQRLTLGKLNEGQIQLLTGGGSAGKAFADKIGIDDLYAGKDFAQNIEYMKREKILTKAGNFGIDTLAETKEIMNAKNESALSPAARRASRGRDFQNDIESGALIDILSGRAAPKGIPGITTPGNAGEVDKIKVAQAEGQLKILEEGRNVVGSLNNVSSALKGIADNFKPEMMSRAVQDAADNFSIPVQKFGNAVDRLVDKLDVLDNRRKK